MCARLALALCFVLSGTLAHAASEALVREYMTLSEAFYARMGTSRVLATTDAQKQRFASCVLSDFEAERGAGGVDQLMAMMRSLSKGVKFDDPAVVKFNDAHGSLYRATLASCRNSIQNG